MRTTPSAVFSPTESVRGAPRLIVITALPGKSPITFTSTAQAPVHARAAARINPCFFIDERPEGGRGLSLFGHRRSGSFCHIPRRQPHCLEAGEARRRRTGSRLERGVCRAGLHGRADERQRRP